MTPAKLRNLTPHAVVLLVGEDRVELPAENPPARVAVTTSPAEPIVVDGISLPVVKASLGMVEGLPAPTEGVWLVVSSVVANASKHRNDLLTPGDFVRDEAGHIIGARHLVRTEVPSGTSEVPQ